MKLKKIIAREGLILLLVLFLAFIFAYLYHKLPINITHAKFSDRDFNLPFQQLFFEDIVKNFILIYSIHLLTRFIIWAVRTLKHRERQTPMINGIDNALRTEVRIRCQNEGLTRVRELLEIPGKFNSKETPIVRAWIKEQEFKQKMKITFKDYIGWVIAVVLGLLYLSK